MPVLRRSQRVKRALSNSTPRRPLAGSPQPLAGSPQPLTEIANPCDPNRPKNLSTKSVSKKSPTKSMGDTLPRNKELALTKKGYTRICGVDEAGRGPLAGPVVAACCIVPNDVVIEGINDSKKVNEERRDILYKKIIETPGIEYGIAVSTVQEIDEINILNAALLAMSRSVDRLGKMPDYLLVDGNRLPEFSDASIPVETVVKGDSKVYSIAAASILAKVYRDKIMEEYDAKWPAYKFGQHKGYPTAQHRSLLVQHGPSPVHRLSFGPVKKLLPEEQVEAIESKIAKFKEQKKRKKEEMSRNSGEGASHIREATAPTNGYKRRRGA